MRPPRAVLAAALVSVCATARAEAPLSHAAALIGVSQNIGDLGDRFTYGVVFGTEAAIQIKLDKDHPYDFGLAWSLLYGYYVPSAERSVEDSLTVVELAAVVRARVRLPGIDLYAIVEGGAEFYRASVPIPPGDDQTFIGPIVGVGFELAWAQDKIFSLALRYGLVGDGPAGLRLLLGVGVGL